MFVLSFLAESCGDDAISFSAYTMSCSNVCPNQCRDRGFSSGSSVHIATDLDLKQRTCDCRCDDCNWLF